MISGLLGFVFICSALANPPAFAQGKSAGTTTEKITEKVTDKITDKAPEKSNEKSSEKLTSNNKIEELFIWKISDELKLSNKEEKNFADLFRDLNRKKSNLAHLQDETLTKISASTKSKDRDANLSDYRKLIQDYDKIQLREFDEMKKILGSERLAKYLSVKRDLTNKVKNLLTEKTEKKDSELPAPKVIEE